jgi:Pro-kumamolisin, activation domain
VDAVHNWLASAGIAPEQISQSVNKQWMQFDASTLELESLLNAEYHIYENAGTGKTTVACDKCVNSLKLTNSSSTNLNIDITFLLIFKSTSTTSPLASNFSVESAKQIPTRILRNEVTSFQHFSNPLG